MQDRYLPDRLPDQIGGLFADHDGRRIGVAADQGRHDRGIDHAQALDAMHLQLRIDHGHRIGPHLAGADRVIDRIDPRAQDGADVVVGLHVGGEHVLFLQCAQRRRLHQPPRGLEARDHRLQIGGLAEEIRIDQRRLRRIAARKRDAAAALRPQQADVTGEACLLVALAAMVVEQRHDQMELDVGHVEIGAGFQEAPAFAEIGRDRPAALAAILEDGTDQPRQPA